MKVTFTCKCGTKLDYCFIDSNNKIICPVCGRVKYRIYNSHDERYEYINEDELKESD